MLGVCSARWILKKDYEMHLVHLLHQLEFRIRAELRFIFHVTPFNIAIDGKNSKESNMWKVFSTLGSPI